MEPSDGSFERKVQLTGGSTYTVSLPKEWATSQQIENGSTVSCQVRGDRLIISQNHHGKRREIQIEAGSRAPADVARHVVAAYTAGVETVRIDDVQTQNQRRAVRSAIDGLVGIEVHQETDQEVVARTMLDVTALSPEQTLMQMEMVTLSMHEDAIGNVASREGSMRQQVAQLDDDVDRLFELLAREFQRSLVNVPTAANGDGLCPFDYYTAARQLERIADHAEKVGNVASRLDGEPDQKMAETLRSLGKRSRDIVRQALAAFLDGRGIESLQGVVAETNAFLSEAESVRRELYELEATAGYPLGIVLDSIVRTAEYGVNIADAGIHAAMRERAAP